MNVWHLMTFMGPEKTLSGMFVYCTYVCRCCQECLYIIHMFADVVRNVCILYICLLMLSGMFVYCTYVCQCCEECLYIVHMFADVVRNVCILYICLPMLRTETYTFGFSNTALLKVQTFIIHIPLPSTKLFCF